MANIRLLKAVHIRIPTRFAKILVVVLLLHGIYFFTTILRFNGLDNGSLKNLQYHSNSFHDEVASLSDDPIFERELMGKFSEIESDQSKFWLAHTEMMHSEAEIAIKKFLHSLDFNTSWANSNELFFDPRFTFSVYLDELKQCLLAAGGESSSPVTLPFSWSDWIDLTLLNDELNKPLDERLKCEYVRLNSRNEPDTSLFCADVDKITDEEVKDMGFLRREQLPGFLIFAHEAHPDKPYNDVRVMQAKSYSLTRLPNPLQVIMLAGGQRGGTYEFHVSPRSDARLATTDMVENYVKRNYEYSSNITEDHVIIVDHLREYNDLLEKVQPDFLSSQEDVHSLYKTIIQQADPSASRQLKLTKEMFHYSQEDVDKQVKEYEQMGADVEKLSENEKLYYQSLKEFVRYRHAEEPEYFKLATLRKDDYKNLNRDSGWHYDWRFFNGALNYKRIGWSRAENTVRTRIILERLLRNWYRFSMEKGLISWIMHGPLLGWYWNGLTFPYDLDLDIQMPISELVRLAKLYNQTLVVEDPSEGYGKFLIDVGTFIHNRSISDSNYIDARFIDTDTGLYIDITGLGRSDAMPPEEYKNNPLVNIKKKPGDVKAEIYNDRRKHFYTLNELSPLKYTMLSGVPVFVPREIIKRLKFEYPNGLTSLYFDGWYFVPKLQLWLRKEHMASVLLKPGQNENHLIKMSTKAVLKRIKKMTTDDVLTLLEDESLLVEYYLTRNLTNTHLAEKDMLFNPYTTQLDSTSSDPHPEDNEDYNRLTSTFEMARPLRKCLYVFEQFDRLEHHVADAI